MNHKEGLKILALIPARAGSKRVKNKNIRVFRGKPLIAHTIEQAKSSKYINRIIVTTDGPEIAKISQEYGAEVPFMRPAAISADDSVEIEYYKHALKWLAGYDDYKPDIIVNMYLT